VRERTMPCQRNYRVNAEFSRITQILATHKMTPDVNAIAAARRTPAMSSFAVIPGRPSPAAVKHALQHDRAEALDPRARRFRFKMLRNIGTGGGVAPFALSKRKERPATREHHGATAARRVFA